MSQLTDLIKWPIYALEEIENYVRKNTWDKEFTNTNMP